MHKLQAQLQSLHKQLQVDSMAIAVPQEAIKHGVDASYKLCFDVARKIEQEQLALRDEIETLTKDKSQLKKEYLEEIERLSRDLEKKGITLLLIARIVLIYTCILIT